MADIVNLHRARKNKARAGKEREAQGNRAAFGRTRAQKALAKTLGDKAARDLDGHRRGGDDGGGAS